MNQVSETPSSRALHVARAIYDGYETTDQDLISAARMIDIELMGDSHTIRQQRSEIMRLLGVLWTKTLFGKPLDYWMDADERIIRQQESLDVARATAADAGRWKAMLDELLKLPTGKKDEENIAQAVTRYVGELTQALVALQAQVDDRPEPTPVAQDAEPKGAIEAYMASEAAS